MAEDDAPNNEREAFHLDLHAWMEQQQTSHGVRHDDYHQYRMYCTRRLSKLRHNPEVQRDLVHSSKFGGGKKGTNRTKHAYCARDNILSLSKPNDDKDGEDNEENLEKQKQEEEAPDLVDDNDKDTNGTKDDNSSPVVPHENYLWVLLVSAERAWAQACESTNSNSGNHHYVVRRLRKAQNWATKLVELASIDGVVDGVTQLECMAYEGWMTGNWALEAREYETAAQSFAKAMSLCFELAKLADDQKDNEGGENSEEGKKKADKTSNQRMARYDLFVTRAETVLRPLFRYCIYELKEAGLETVPEPKLSPSSGANDADVDDDSAIIYRGHQLSIDDKDLHVLLLKFQSIQNGFNGETGIEATDETVFLPSLSALDDALVLVQTKLQALSSDANAGPSILAKRESYDMWKGYLTGRKIHLVMEHTESLIMKGDGPEDSSNQMDHAGRVHIYDSLLRHAGGLLQLPRPPDIGDDDDEFVLQAQANMLRIRAFKCYHMALYYYERRQQYANALTLLKQSERLTKRALEEIAACDEDMPHADEYMEALEMLQTKQLVGATAAVRAALMMQNPGAFLSGDAGSDTPATASAASATITTNTNRSLLMRLDDLDAGLILADVPPVAMPLPCKPVFYDVAYSHAASMDASFHTLHDFVDKHAPAKEDEAVASASGSGVSSLFGWLSGSK